MNAEPRKIEGVEINTKEIETLTQKEMKREKRNEKMTGGIMINLIGREKEITREKINSTKTKRNKGIPAIKTKGEKRKDCKVKDNTGINELLSKKMKSSKTKGKITKMINKEKRKEKMIDKEKKIDKEVR